MKTRAQCGHGNGSVALWLRTVAAFCMVLIGVASTVQVCHTHDDRFEAKLVKATPATGDVFAQVASDEGPSKTGDTRIPGHRDSDSDSAVRCPLCVAMHSVLPVSGLLVQVALLRMEMLAPHVDDVERVFRWRFEMASRPPPALASRA